MKKIKANSVFNLLKHSMGFKWRSYRPQFDWFKLDDIENGRNESWDELVALNPSLQYALLEFSKVFKEKKMMEFEDRYNVTPETISKFFNIYVGYHPSFGLYLCSIGPYKGPKEEDAQNKFGYFTHRLASTDSDNLRTFLTSFLNDSKSNFPAIAKNLGFDSQSLLRKERDKTGMWQGGFERDGMWSILDESDFTINVRHRTGDRRGSSQWSSFGYEQIDASAAYMQENDIELAKKEGREIPYRTVIGIGSYIQLKPQGMAKILKALAEKNGQKPEVMQIVEGIAARRGISPDQISTMFQSDSEFAKEVCDEYGKINPLMNGLFSPRRFGAQQPDALTTPKEFLRSMALKEEIIKAIVLNGSEDPNIIANFMNQNRIDKGLAKGKLTPELVDYMLGELRVYREVKDDQGNVIGERSYSETLPEFQKDYIQAQSQRGFDDMDSVMRMASLYVAGAVERVDPVTKAKLITVPPIFDIAEGTKNYTSQELTQLRDGIELPEEENEIITIPEELDELDEGINNDVKEEIVQPSDSVVIEEPDVQVNRPPVKRIRNKPAKVPNVPVKQNIDQIEKPVETEGEILARTLKGLNKVAKELRDKGQHKAALGILKVVSKYKGIRP